MSYDLNSNSIHEYGGAYSQVHKTTARSPNIDLKHQFLLLLLLFNFTIYYDSDKNQSKSVQTLRQSWNFLDEKESQLIYNFNNWTFVIFDV